MPTQRISDHRYPSIVAGAALILLLGLPTDSWAAPEATQFQGKLRNVELCNGADRSSTEPQIKGCTALIESGKETTLVLSIAHTNRGNAYAAKGEFDRAISDYDLAIKYNPSFSKPFNNRGVAFLKTGNYDGAIKDFDEAIKLTPDYARAFANRAEANQKRHDYQSAVRDYDSAIRLSPGLEAVLNGRCWSRAILGQLQPALADCNKALSTQPNDAAALELSRIDLPENGPIRFRHSGLQFGPPH